MIYQWKAGARTTMDAQVVGEELERLLALHNGKLETNLVVESARSPLSPLHPEFEWDDRRAAEEHRKDRAKYLIRAIVVIPAEAAAVQPIHAFVEVQGRGEARFTSVAHALANPALRQQVLDAALRELEAWRHRYAELAELADVFAVIDQARAA